ncbi:hypothetical protein [Nocardioides sp.]|uniref:hypothetical protein n=1 Tax=Nocardioides sp. TaxID=35761 RepID=UPI003569249F
MSKHTNGPDDLRLRDELGRELHQRADRFQAAPLSFDDVRGRAARIQRTRRIKAAAAVAAAVAIIVPVGMFAGQGLNRTEQIPPASQGPSESPSPTPAVQPDPGPHQLDVDAAQGPGAAVPYLDRRLLVRPDGTTRGLSDTYQQFVLVGDEIVALRYEQGDPFLDVIGADGDIVRTVAGVTGLAGNGSQAVWSTANGDLVGWEDGTDSLLATPGGEVAVAAVVGDLRSPDFAVYFNRGYGESPMVTVGGEPAQAVTEDSIVLTDADARRRTALRVSSSDAGSCSGVHEPGTGLLWESCDYSLTTFSPDGRYVLAPPAYLDGLGYGTLAVLDASTGDLVTTYEIDGGFISSATWEDSSHPLVVTHTDEGWNMLRLGLDGSIELVADPVNDADEMNRPYHFTGRP